MKIEELLRKADFSKHSATHQEALGNVLFGRARKRGQASASQGKRPKGKPPPYELTEEDLERVTAASNAWINPDENFSPTDKGT